MWVLGIQPHAHMLATRSSPQPSRNNLRLPFGSRICFDTCLKYKCSERDVREESRQVVLRLICILKCFKLAQGSCTGSPFSTFSTICTELLVYHILQAKRLKNVKWCTQRSHGSRNMWTHICNHSRQISVEESALNNRGSPENVCSGEPKCFLSKELERLENICRGSKTMPWVQAQNHFGGLLLFWVSLSWKHLVLEP